jgi:photosystem II stability/assembly factor-like uncharacterized protein
LSVFVPRRSRRKCQEISFRSCHSEALKIKLFSFSEFQFFSFFLQQRLIMKTAALFLCSFAVFSGIACAQTWEVQSPLPTSMELTAVCFPDSLHGWVGGFAGLILGTGDGGQTWAEQYLTSSPLNEISGIAFTNALNGWAVSNADLVLHTVDGGATWSPQPTGIATNGGSVYFTSTQNGWIVGSTILHTTDGGNLWEELMLWSPNEFPAACFLDSLHGWLGQSANVFRTINAGATWTRYDTPPAIQVRALAFHDTATGWMLGSFSDTTRADTFQIYRTTNAGQTWTLNANHLSGLSGFVLGANNRLIAYGATTIMTTTDNGQTWQTHSSPAHIHLEAMSTAANRFCAVSRSALIAFTPDGQHWNYSSSGVSLLITNVRFADDRHGWAGGTQEQESAAILLRTSDGGAHWLPCDGAPEAGEVTDLYCTDSLHVWATVSNYTYGNILRSGDGGITWTLQMADTVLSMTGVYFSDELTGWAVGTSGIYHTTDGGAEWTLNYSSEPLSMVTFADAHHGWAAGSSQNLFYTTNGGDAWQSFTTGIFDGFADLQFTDTLHGIAATGNGVVKRTTNGGQTWTTVTGGDWEAVQRVYFADSLRGWMSGYARITYTNTIWATYNGGATWMHLTDVPLSDGLIKDVCLGEALDGWAVGSRQILRYSGVDDAPSVDAAPPRQFSLSVYPNPFNSRTVLSFEVAISGRISLTVFDLMGRVVETVADRVMVPGQYTLSFDARRLSSGMYFVRLSSPVASETRRIVLMR